MPSRSRRPTTGMRWRPSGPARRARTSTWKNRCRHNIWEGPQMVEAARKYDRIVPGGHAEPQQRAASGRPSSSCTRAASARSTWPRGSASRPRESIGRKPDGPVPEGVNYDLWLGPAPCRPFNENRFHYNWHWFWDYGCGGYRQPGRAPDGHRPLGPGQARLPGEDPLRRRVFRFRLRSGDPEHPECRPWSTPTARFSSSRCADYTRMPRTASRSETSSTDRRLDAPETVPLAHLPGAQERTRRRQARPLS